MKPKQNNLSPPSKVESNNHMFVPSHLFASREGEEHGLDGKKSCELELVREGEEWNLHKKEVCLAASEVSLEAVPLKQEHNYRLSILK